MKDHCVDCCNRLPGLGMLFAWVLTECGPKMFRKLLRDASEWNEMIRAEEAHPAPTTRGETQ